MREIHAKGTATAISAFTLMDCSSLTDGETYTISGCPEGGAVSKYRIYMSWSNFSDIGNSYTGEFVKDTTNGNHLRLQVASGQTVDITFEPMLEIGKVAHDFVPYHLGGAKDADTVDGKHADDFLSSAGGKLSGDLTVEKNGHANVTAYANATANAYVHAKNNLKDIALVVNNSGACGLYSLTDSKWIIQFTADKKLHYAEGMMGGKTVHHDGNSAKVVISASAPGDTTALWYDTVNKICKRYVDGAWQA